jgi:hypothetical protein
MTTIAIMPETPGSQNTTYRAVAGHKQAVGRTVGEALDALARQLDDAEGGTLIVVQQRRPDQFFTAPQQERLQDLMTRWRTARDGNTELSPEEQAELDALINEEVRAAGARAAALARGTSS